MTDEQLIRALRRLDGATEPGPRFADELFDRLGRERLRAGHRRPGGAILFIAAAVALAIAAGVLAVGSRGLPIPAPAPPIVPSALPTEMAPTSVATSIAPVAGRIVYTRWKTLKDGQEDCTSLFCHRASVFIADDDGSNEREIISGPYSHLLAASPDGSKLIVSIREARGDNVYLTDVDGSARRPLDTHCQSGCQGDFAFGFSADGSRLAFMRTRSGEPGPSGEDIVVATMDMASGAVVELESSHDFPGRPGLSSDGARVAFGNHLVDVEGSNLREIAPANLFTEQSGAFYAGLAAPQWSPDGSFVAFTSYNETFPTNPPERNSQVRIDIFVVRPDGTDFRRLTTDTVGPLGTNRPGDFGASFPTWTRDGRIVFTRYPANEEDPFELWVMNPDGSNATRVDPSNAAALTALGCDACPYPGTTYHDTGVPSFAFWIPGP
jgi:Tol biopolymer transport system component